MQSKLPSSSPSQPLFGEYQPPPIFPRVKQILKLIEITITLASLILVSWQIITLDRQMIFLILWWTTPAFLAAYGALSSKSTPMGRFLATSFLVVLSIGFGIAKSPNLFPNLGHAADPNNPLDQLGNRLPLASRRILFWYFGTYSCFFMIFLGYFAFYRDLRTQRLGRRPQLSPLICIFGLLVTWALPLLGGLGLVIGGLLRN